MIRSALFGAAFAAAAIPAAAQDWWPNGLASTGLQPGNFYIDVTGTGGIQPLPKIVTLGRYAGGVGSARVEQITAEFDTVVGGAGGEFGYVLPNGALPAWLGTKARIGLSGGYWTGRSSTRGSASGNPGFSFLALNGTAIAFTGGATVETNSFDLRRSGYRLGLRFATDYAVGLNWTLTPMIGAFGGTAYDNYNILVVPGNAVLDVPMETQAKIATTRIGGSLGLGARYQATPWLSFGLAGTVDLAHVRASLNAADCVVAVAVPKGAACRTAAAFAVSSFSASASQFGVRLGGQANMSFDFDWFVLTAAGHVQWDNKVPVFVGPTTLVNLVPGQQGTPAGIRFGSEVGYGASLTARFPLRF